MSTNLLGILVIAAALLAFSNYGRQRIERLQRQRIMREFDVERAKRRAAQARRLRKTRAEIQELHEAERALDRDAPTKAPLSPSAARVESIVLQRTASRALARRNERRASRVKF